MRKDWQLSYIERRRTSYSLPVCIARATAAVLCILLTLYILWVIGCGIASAVNTITVEWIDQPETAAGVRDPGLPSVYPDPVCDFCGQILDGSESHTCPGSEQ